MFEIIGVAKKNVAVNNFFDSRKIKISVLYKNWWNAVPNFKRKIVPAQRIHTCHNANERGRDAIFFCRVKRNKKIHTIRFPKSTASAPVNFVPTTSGEQQRTNV